MARVKGQGEALRTVDRVDHLVCRVGITPPAAKARREATSSSTTTSPAFHSLYAPQHRIYIPVPFPGAAARHTPAEISSSYAYSHSSLSHILVRLQRLGGHVLNFLPDWNLVTSLLRRLSVSSAVSSRRETIGAYTKSNNTGCCSMATCK
ncbi:hypothetical protein BDY19DRAFT_360529 [Irpex rosettiformis]|uniref:Uncharacterized protein n=1 Tax=Irpex rosettiformis TaxID=378272 RepID=A0ACB8TWN0_9APHY|nr:hypothetical protein BDY19DRAFT_360529 [Irpex rosettiformis]